MAIALAKSAKNRKVAESLSDEAQVRSGQWLGGDVGEEIDLSMEVLSIAGDGLVLRCAQRNGTTLNQFRLQNGKGLNPRGEVEVMVGRPVTIINTLTGARLKLSKVGDFRLSRTIV